MPTLNTIHRRCRAYAADARSPRELAWHIIDVARRYGEDFSADLIRRNYGAIASMPCLLAECIRATEVAFRKWHPHWPRNDCIDAIGAMMMSPRDMKKFGEFADSEANLLAVVTAERRFFLPGKAGDAPSKEVCLAPVDVIAVKSLSDGRWELVLDPDCPNAVAAAAKDNAALSLTTAAQQDQ